MEQVAACNSPGRIAAAVLFLSSSHPSYITGTTLVIDGGYTAQCVQPVTGAAGSTGFTLLTEWGVCFNSGFCFSAWLRFSHR
jgi:hypothetical protein